MRVVFRCDPAIEGLSCCAPFQREAALPDWLRAMPRTAFSDLHGQEVRTVKQCPRFVDAMSHGFIIPLPCNVTVHDGILSWDWDHPALTVEAHPRSPVSFHVPAQVTGTPFYDSEVAIVKFNSFWTIELEPGYSLFATHPVNRADLPFRLLTGVVDCDRFTDVGICFPPFGRMRISKACCPGARRRAVLPDLRERSSFNSSRSGGRIRALPVHRGHPAPRIPAHIDGDFVSARALRPQENDAVALNRAKGGLSWLTSAPGRCGRTYRAEAASRVDSIHRGVEIAGVLQIKSQVDMGFRNVRLRLDAAPIGPIAPGVSRRSSQTNPARTTRGRRPAEESGLVQARCGPIGVRPSDAGTIRARPWLRQGRAPPQAPVEKLTIASRGRLIA